jgi:ABC-type uncharacterized transport system ATPase subunit
MTGMLDIEGLTKRFWRDYRRRPSDLRRRPREVLGFLGPNGREKRTTMR